MDRFLQLLLDIPVLQLVILGIGIATLRLGRLGICRSECMWFYLPWSDSHVDHY